MEHKGKGRWARHTCPALFAAGGLLGAFIATAMLVRRLHRVAVQGPSMAPALLDGDRVLVDRGAYRRARPRTGDIVLARVPSVPGGLVLKRVAAIADPGPVRARAGKGGPARRNPGTAGIGTGTSVRSGDLTLWLLGDNAPWSTDSRHFGPVAAHDVLGRVWYRYEPAERRGRIAPGSEQHRG